jgi:hypothetical protein
MRGSELAGAAGFEEVEEQKGTAIRISVFTYIVLGLVVFELLAIALSLSQPWGLGPGQKEIRLGLEGLVPWFLFVPVLLQLGFFTLKTRAFRTFYIILNMLIALFVGFINYLTFYRFDTSFKFGFYMVFIAAGLAIVAGVVEALESALFPRMLARGTAREKRFGKS